jgi:dipeptidyl aminopeptidase/acylaminoacyl peptidase
MRLLSLFFASLFAVPALAQTPTPLTLEQAMADPDWIGAPVESAWWAWDGRQVNYSLKRSGSPIRDTYLQAIDGSPGAVAKDTELGRLDAPGSVYSPDRTHAVFVRNGDVFERDQHDGTLVQITRSADEESDPQFAADGKSVQFRVGVDWFRWNPGDRLVTPAALPRAEKDPHPTAETDPYRQMQLRLSSTLAHKKADHDALAAREEALRLADPTRPLAMSYLGSDVHIDASSLSPDGRWLLVITSAKDANAGKADQVVHYVSESGYVEPEDVRPRVGRNSLTANSLKLVDLRDNHVHNLAFATLPGIAIDPLAALRKAAKLDPLKGDRPVRIAAIDWSGDGRRVVVDVRSVDNKDRWITGVDFDQGQLQTLHRLTDPAWINWDYNELGWLPDNKTLWYLSEESGYSHLYTLAERGMPVALTSGHWEASAVQWSPDGGTAYFLCNQKTPGDYEVCSVPRGGGTVRELTALGGVEDFTLSPDASKLLLRYSGSYLPAQLAVVPANGGEATKLTDTRTAEFKARNWIAPQFVQVPSTHGAGAIWAKLYRPAQLEPGKKYPVVMFVHGAGYLQNVSERYTYYFREQMFNNLLVQHGYVVLDMDYRASQGYGRDWRTAIYRQMGHPELDDYVDGVNWMVAHQQGDAGNVGIYGGSYGGFMTFMALFRAPETFKAGAALRPVTDWTSYNNEYTSAILNTPDVDPEAYKTSSPIEYADGLRGHLLIAHGMIDDNVLFQDSVRLSQRLIEMRKDHWTLASYPLERHSFVNPESWYDEYRRIFELFESSLK